MQFWLKFPSLYKVMPDFSFFPPAWESWLAVLVRVPSRPPAPRHACGDLGAMSPERGSGSGRGLRFAEACGTWRLLLSARTWSLTAELGGKGAVWRIDRCVCVVVVAFRGVIFKPDAVYRNAREMLASQSTEPVRLQVYCPIFRKTLGFGS